MTVPPPDPKPEFAKPYKQRRRKAARVFTYGSVIMDTLMAATKPPGVSVQFPTLAMAMAFRRRLYELRGAMDREKHPDFDVTMSVQIFIDSGRTKDDPATVRLRPADIQFVEAVRHAGIRPRSEAIAPTPTEGTPIDPARVMSQFDDLLKELK